MPLPEIAIRFAEQWSCRSRLRLATDGFMRSEVDGAPKSLPAVAITSDWRSSGRSDIAAQRVGPYVRWKWLVCCPNETISPAPNSLPDWIIDLACLSARKISDRCDAPIAMRAVRARHSLPLWSQTRPTFMFVSVASKAPPSDRTRSLTFAGQMLRSYWRGSSKVKCMAFIILRSTVLRVQLHLLVSVRLCRTGKIEGDIRATKSSNSSQAKVFD